MKLFELRSAPFSKLLGSGLIAAVALDVGVRGVIGRGNRRPAALHRGGREPAIANNSRLRGDLTSMTHRCLW